MATHYLNKTTHKTWNINKSNDSWVLGEDGRIIGNGFTGVLASDLITDATIRINGDIALGGLSSGMRIGAQHAEITIGKNGYVFCGGYAVYYNNGESSDEIEVGTASIYNKGVLEGFGGIAAVTAEDGGYIRNAGRIDVSGDGIVSLGVDNTIVNSGVIKAGSNGIMAGTTAFSSEALQLINSVRIVNEGTIKGSGNSIEADGVAVNISNRGLLRGDVLMGDGDDIFTSGQGTVKGDILAGGGNDIIAMQGANFEGAIHGGAGDDTVTLASIHTIYIENEGEGIDTVRVDGSYTLGDNIENVVLLGGNHGGTGNALDNWIRGMNGVNILYGEAGNDVLDGGKGNDELTGDDGADVFVFKTGYGSDQIVDFEKGVDKIDLANFDGIASFYDLTINSVDADLVITFNDTDELVLYNANANEMVLTADDFIF